MTHKLTAIRESLERVAAMLKNSRGVMEQLSRDEVLVAVAWLNRVEEEMEAEAKQ